MNKALISVIRACFSKDKKIYCYIRNVFGFTAGNIFLYKLAFRHRSLAIETSNGIRISNERLEFLGDAVLSSTIADFLFKKFPYKDEGFLTEMRSKIVNRSHLNKLSKKLGMDQFIESDNESRSFGKSIGGDTFEAFIGALYLDKGYSFTMRIIIDRIIKVHLDIDELEQQENNFKSKLIEWAQKEKKNVEFNVIDEVGDGYKKQYHVEIKVDQEQISTAYDFSIKGAEKIAAEKAFNIISND